MVDTLLVQDVYDALRIRSGSGKDEGQRDAQLASYISVMTGHGAGVLDRVEVKEAGAHDEGEATQCVSVTFATPSDLWRAIKRNINKGGVFLQMPPFAAMDTVIEMQVTVENPAVEFQGLAKVIFVNPQKRSGRPMGVDIKFLWEGDKPALFKSFLKGEIDPSELATLGLEAPEPTESESEAGDATTAAAGA